MPVPDSLTGNPSRRPGRPLTLLAAYTLFVVYGSMVPLRFVPLPLDQAWVAFQAIPFLKLGLTSRADWVANGVLYLPLGFLTAHWLLERHSAIARPVALGLAAVFPMALAVVVEFVQLYFPQPSKQTVFDAGSTAHTISFLRLKGLLRIGRRYLLHDGLFHTGAALTTMPFSVWSHFQDELE